MITYNNFDLFSSGPGSIDPGPLHSREAISNAPDSIGASVISQGTTPRTLTQIGTLVADTPEALQQLINAIEAHIGTGQATLIDQHANAWPDCLMQSVDTQAFHRLGPRVAADYKITYLQTRP